MSEQRGLDDIPAEQVLAHRVDHVDEHRQQRDQHEVAIGKDHREAVALRERLVIGGLGRRGRIPLCDPVDDACQQGTDDQRHRRAHHQAARTHGHQLPGAHRPDPGAEAGAHADQRKQPLALLGRVEVGGKRPELRDDHQIEDAHPQEIGDADVQAGAERQQEQGDVRDEEHRHPLHELHAVHAGGEGTVGRHEKQQQQGLSGRRVALDLRAALAEDEDLAGGLEQVIRGQDQEHEQRHQQDARHLVPPDVGDRRQQPLAQGLGPCSGASVVIAFHPSARPRQGRMGSACVRGRPASSR